MWGKGAMITAAASDPRGFLEAYPPPVIFDEVQYAPELLPYVRERIDGHRQGARLRRAMAPIPKGMVSGAVCTSSTHRPSLGGRCARGHVIHPGNVRLPLGQGVQALPFGDL